MSNAATRDMGNPGLNQVLLILAEVSGNEGHMLSEFCAPAVRERTDTAQPNVQSTLNEYGQGERSMFRLSRWCLTFCFCAMMLVVPVCGFGFELKSVTTYALLDRTGPDGPVADTVQVRLARGEFHNAVVMVDNRQAHAKNIEFTALVWPAKDTASSLPAEAIHLSRTVHTANPDGDRGGKRPSAESADQLLPMTDADVVGCPAGEARYLWLTVDARKLAAREYRTQVVVRSVTPIDETKTTDVQVTVWPFALPERLPVSVMAFDCERGTSSDAWLRHFLEYKINTFHVRVPPSDDANVRWGKGLIHKDGSLVQEPDFSDLTARIQRAKPYAEYFLFETFCFHGTNWPCVEETEWGWQAPYMSEPWKRGFTPWIKSFVEYLKSQGVPYSQWLWYPYDESMAEGFLEQVKLIHEIDPNIQAFVDAATADTDTFKQWRPHVAVWCPGSGYTPPTEPHVKLIRDSGAKLWNYVSGRRCGPSTHHGATGAVDGRDGPTSWMG